MCGRANASSAHQRLPELHVPQLSCPVRKAWPAIVELGPAGCRLALFWLGGRVAGKPRALTRAKRWNRAAKLGTLKGGKGHSGGRAFVCPSFEVGPVALIGFSPPPRPGSSADSSHGVDSDQSFGRGTLAFRGPDVSWVPAARAGNRERLAGFCLSVRFLLSLPSGLGASDEGHYLPVAPTCHGYLGRVQVR